MYAKNAFTFALLSALAAFVTASPHDVTPVPRAALANQAIVNMFSGTTCGGNVQSFTVTGNGAFFCQAVNSPKASIQISENNCLTRTWSGNNCQGSNLHVHGDVCTTVLFASVSVQC